MTEALRPKLLSKEEVNAIYEKCLDILSNKGVKVDHTEGLKLLDKAGAQVDFDGQWVRFPKDTIESALKSVPRGFTMGGENIVPHPNGTFYVQSETAAPTYLDPDSNTHRDTTLSDIREWCQLQEVLDEITIATYLFPTDAPIETADIHALKVTFENTSKYIFMVPYSFESLEYLFELAQVMAGGTEALKKKPILHTNCDAVSPLTFKAMDMEVILQSRRHGQPVSACSLPNAGANAPVTIAGEVLLSAVETLAVIVMSQLIEPRTPVIANPYLSALDMVKGKNLNSTVEAALANAAIAQFIKDAYNIPIIGCGLFTDSHIPDGQSAIEGALMGQLLAMSGCDVLCGAGSIGTSMCVNPVKLIIDNMMARILKRIRSGLNVNDDTLAWQEILDTKPGGHFLDSPHTLKHCREALRPELFTTLDLEAWKAAGSKDLYARALDKYRELKKELKPLQLPEDMQKELNRIVKHADEHLVK